MLHWISSPDGLFVVLATVLLAGAACVLAPSRAVGPFLLVALLLWAVATPFAASGSPTLRGGMAAALWAGCVVALAGSVLGLLLVRGTRARTLLLAAGALLAIGIPVAFLAQVLLQCYVGRYCPGIA